jgi:hypothetical protein
MERHHPSIPTAVPQKVMSEIEVLRKISPAQNVRELKRARRS